MSRSTSSVPDSKDAYFPIIEYENASPAIQEIYDDTKRSLQIPFVLNWFKCQGTNETLLKGNWTKLKNTLIEGVVPNILKQLIIYNVSKTRGCDYCTKAHGAFADSLRGTISDQEDFKPTEDLNSPIIPQSYRTAITIISKAALNSDTIDNADFKALSDAGFDVEEIQELMAQADLVNMLNTISYVSGIKIDNELVETQA